MKNKLLLLFLFAFFIFCFFIFYKSVNTDSSYKPNENLEKKINNFIAEDFFSGDKIESQELFKKNKFYIVNIWAAWCRPCREEHPKLMELSKNQNVQLIGINYRDNKKKAKQFIEDYGNPFSLILYDKKGTVAIELGAYGIPETFIINKDKKIIKKYLGALTDQNLKEIYSTLK